MLYQHKNKLLDKITPTIIKAVRVKKRIKFFPSEGLLALLLQAELAPASILELLIKLLLLGLLLVEYNIFALPTLPEENAEGATFFITPPPK